MLRRLRIENLVLIREAELSLAPGLNAITGETGAGKTILAQAIGLLLGARGARLPLSADGGGPTSRSSWNAAGFFDDEENAALAELRPDERGWCRPTRLSRRPHARLRLGPQRRP